MRPKKLLLLTSFAIPGTLIPLSVSCKKINYEEDIKIKFKNNQNKENFFASDVEKNIEISSKTTVKYTIQKLDFDDTKGIATLTLLPTKNGKTDKTFKLNLSGFKKKLEAIVNKVGDVDLLDKSTSTVSNYITKHSQKLKEKIILPSLEGKKANEYFAEFKVSLTPILKIKDDNAGIAELTISYSLGDQFFEKKYEILGFQQQIQYQEDQLINSLGLIGLKDSENQYAHKYDNTEENLKKSLTSDKQNNVTTYLTKNEITITKAELADVNKNEGTASLKLTFSFKSNNSLTKTYAIKFKKYLVKVDDVIAQLGDLDLNDKNKNTTESYKKSIKVDNLVFSGIHGKTTTEFLNEIIDVQIEIKFETIDKLAGTAKVILTFKNVVTNESKQKEYQIQGLLKDLPLEQVLPKITSIDLKDKEKYSLDGYRLTFSDLFSQLTSTDNFGENITINEYLNSYTVNTEISLSEINGTSGKLSIKFSKDGKEESKEYTITGFKQKKTLEEVANSLGELSLEGSTELTLEKYLELNGDKLVEKLKSSNNISIKEELTAYAIIATAVLEKVKGNSKDAKLKVKFTKISETKEKEYTLTNAFKENKLADLFDSLENIQLDGAESSDIIEYKKTNADLKTKIKVESKNAETIKNEIAAKNYSLEVVEISTFKYEDGSYALKITLKDNETNEFITKEFTPANKFKALTFEQVIEKAGSIDLNNKGSSLPYEYVIQYESEPFEEICATLEYLSFLKANGIEIKTFYLNQESEEEGTVKLTLVFKSNQFAAEYQKEYIIAGFKVNLSLDKVLEKITAVDLEDKSTHTVDSYKKEFKFTLQEKITGTINSLSLAEFLTSNQAIITNAELEEKPGDSTTGLLTITFYKGEEKTKSFDIAGFKANKLSNFINETGKIKLSGSQSDINFYEYRQQHSSDLEAQLISDKISDNAAFKQKLTDAKVKLTSVKLVPTAKLKDGIGILQLELEDQNDATVKKTITSEIQFKVITIDEIVSELGVLDIKNKENMYAKLFASEFNTLNNEQKLEKFKFTKNSTEIQAKTILEKYGCEYEIKIAKIDDSHADLGSLLLYFGIKTEWGEGTVPTGIISGFKISPLLKLLEGKELELEGADPNLRISEYKKKFSDLTKQVKTKTENNEQFIKYLDEKGAELATVELVYSDESEPVLVITLKEKAEPRNTHKEYKVLTGILKKAYFEVVETASNKDAILQKNWKYNDSFAINTTNIEFEQQDENWVTLLQNDKIYYDYKMNAFSTELNDGEKLLEIKNWDTKITFVNKDKPAKSKRTSNPEIEVKKSDDKVELEFRLCNFSKKEISSKIYKITYYI
ncbi:lipoprotein 17-related variable surface protein [Metamycoplasma hyosynoviae]|uniref:lipoprotein 17-related variable surface protein n=1 Tax=Metamycoplasma hyosynoviae TaxID=29559 RepID=UPI00249AE69A|nr:lipoprotein 17-related variable surface protein [Metamycoplasma hyosynoviae]MDI3063619.1 lipoprotein 17-related variable surface protein [Metamycoplasma hyosynoviae]